MSCVMDISDIRSNVCRKKGIRPSGLWLEESLLSVSKPSPWPSWSSPRRQRHGWRCWAAPRARSASWGWSHPRGPSSPRSDRPAGRRSLSADPQKQNSGVIICLCWDWVSLLKLETSCSTFCLHYPNGECVWLTGTYNKLYGLCWRGLVHIKFFFPPWVFVSLNCQQLKVKFVGEVWLLACFQCTFHATAVKSNAKSQCCGVLLNFWLSCTNRCKKSSYSNQTFLLETVRSVALTPTSQAPTPPWKKFVHISFSRTRPRKYLLHSLLLITGIWATLRTVSSPVPRKQRGGDGTLIQRQKQDTCSMEISIINYCNSTLWCEWRIKRST